MMHSAISPDAVGAAYLGLEHVFFEAAAIEASLLSGIVVAGTSALATYSAATLGLSAALIPFTATGVAAGGYLFSVGVSGNIDILNTLLDPIVGRVIPNPFHGVPEIPEFPVFSGRGH